jgi:hypothetical protein
VINGKIQHPTIAQYDTRQTKKCLNEINKWALGVLVPYYTELKYLKKSVIDKQENEDESG